MKIIVTGAEGFLGKELIRQCRKEKINVIKIDSVFGHDIRSDKLLKLIPPAADALIHLAALSFNYQHSTDVRELFDVNVLGTLNLIRAAKIKRIKKFIFASSEWVYGEKQAGVESKEDDVINAGTINNPYALSKLVGENSLQSELKNVCPVIILRFSIIYGPRGKNWSAVESLFHSVKMQEPIKIGSLKTARKFIHVSDAAAAIVKSSIKKQNGCVAYNVAADKLISLGDIIKASAKILKKKTSVVEQQPRQWNVRNVSNKKIKRELGWRPQINLTQGLKSLLKFYD